MVMCRLVLRLIVCRSAVRGNFSGCLLRLYAPGLLQVVSQMLTVYKSLSTCALRMLCVCRARPGPSSPQPAETRLPRDGQRHGQPRPESQSRSGAARDKTLTGTVRYGQAAGERGAWSQVRHYRSVTCLYTRRVWVSIE